MLTLAEQLSDPSVFRIGVELVTTRGTLAEGKAVQTRNMARDLTECDDVNWVSITDNAGGNPSLSPMALGKPVLYAGKEVLVHLSCKDFNRSGLESVAWQMASEGFHNILALTGDYPTSGYQGHAKPVFDIDSVGLLTMLNEMNRGLRRPSPKAQSGVHRLKGTTFHMGAVTTNFKLHENEVIPQYLKLEKKLASGASFIICQIGYDARKIHEQKAYLDRRGAGGVPLIGNVFLLSRRIAEFFHSGRIPGVVVSETLRDLCASWGRDKQPFIEFAAKQVAIFRGLGYRGAYIGGVDTIQDVNRILELERSYAADDWKSFAKEIRYSRPGEFFLFAEDPASGLVDPDRLNPAYERSLETRSKTKNVTWSYRLSRWMHDVAFMPNGALYETGKGLYARAKNAKQGPAWLRKLEHASKSVLFGCKDCGDCSLPDIAFLCPESQCAKNQRNGPCGGTRDGKCEVDEFECIWARAYDRLKFEGREQEMLTFPAVLQDQSLRGTSSWANLYQGRCHNSRPKEKKENAHGGHDTSNGNKQRSGGAFCV